MSKRYMMPPMHGDPKKAKLDVSVVDHNFPMSQNNQDENCWGDDNDDEILLLASQACEAYTSEDIATLPDYNQCMQPGLTSTPFEKSQPSTSKSEFTFKKPTSSPPNALKSNYNNVASISHGNRCNLTGNINNKEGLVNNNVCKDCGLIYKQLMEFRNENSKLKVDNGKLLEKCVTNDGEVSILRSQLKTCQVAVDNARMERVKVQEKVQMDFTEKLVTTKNEAHDLRTQLDFKNLEIVSLKERCRMLESSKIKMTQVTVTGNDVSSSQRLNSSFAPNNFLTKKKLTSSAAQTDKKSSFLQLHKRFYFDEQQLKAVLPLILQESTEKQISILHYNEKLRKSHDFTQSKCRIFSTFHRLPTTPIVASKHTKTKLSMTSMHEDLSYIASANCFNENLHDKYVNVFNQIRNIYTQLVKELECISQRITAAFYREMDEKYIEATSVFVDIDINNLLKGNSLYKDEQAILARRATSVLSHTISCQKTANIWYDLKLMGTNNQEIDHQTIALLCNICQLLDNASCAVLYSGFLLSLTHLIQNIYRHIQTPDVYEKCMEIIKHIITARAMPVVLCCILGALRKMATQKSILEHLCVNVIAGNLKIDYDQGVVLFKKESCIMQIFLNQIEAALKNIDIQKLTEQLILTTQNLLGLYGNINSNKPNWIQEIHSNSCDCTIIMMQTVVYSLHVCANTLKRTTNSRLKKELSSICRSGITVLYQWYLRDIELSTLCFLEGHSHMFVENCEHMKDNIGLDELQGSMLSELVSSLQPVIESTEIPTTHCQLVWTDSFKNFSISD